MYLIKSNLHVYVFLYNTTFCVEESLYTIFK